ncbi:hypothetical protein [Methanosarcina barkeri]|uniref:hypothetical protein n=1 Tax=Methanosarcina barkeri TaxID=2208 RepID=UPI001E48D98B|nr:hypothetical protein [Methanosarcina barkeri]
MKACLILRRYTKQLTDHRYRNWVGEILDNVNRRLAFHSIYLSICKADQFRFHVSDSTWCVRWAKWPCSLPAYSIVLRRIQTDKTWNYFRFRTLVGCGCFRTCFRCLIFRSGLLICRKACRRTIMNGELAKI